MFLITVLLRNYRKAVAQGFTGSLAERAYYSSLVFPGKKVRLKAKLAKDDSGGI
jgi:hypothetical protein